MSRMTLLSILRAPRSAWDPTPGRSAAVTCRPGARHQPPAPQSGAFIGSHGDRGSQIINPAFAGFMPITSPAQAGLRALPRCGFSRRTLHPPGPTLCVGPGPRPLRGRHMQTRGPASTTRPAERGKEKKAPRRRGFVHFPGEASAARTFPPPGPSALSALVRVPLLAM